MDANAPTGLVVKREPFNTEPVGNIEKQAISLLSQDAIALLKATVKEAIIGSPLDEEISLRRAKIRFLEDEIDVLQLLWDLPGLIGDAKSKNETAVVLISFVGPPHRKVQLLQEYCLSLGFDTSLTKSSDNHYQLLFELE